MILAAELFGAFLVGAVSLLAVLAKYGMRIGQWMLKRKLAQVTKTVPPAPVEKTVSADDWFAS